MFTVTSYPFSCDRAGDNCSFASKAVSVSWILKIVFICSMLDGINFPKLFHKNQMTSCFLSLSDLPDRKNPSSCGVKSHGRQPFHFTSTNLDLFVYGSGSDFIFYLFFILIIWFYLVVLIKNLPLHLTI